jgi:hypothetical protein
MWFFHQALVQAGVIFFASAMMSHSCAPNAVRGAILADMGSWYFLSGLTSHQCICQFIPKL